MCMGGGGGDGGARQRQQEQQRAIEQATERINQAFSGFNEPFYQQRAQAYESYALPELAKQYGQTQRQATFGLADRGLMQGSAARNMNQQLQLEQAKQQQNIANAALGQANQLRKEIGQEQSSLVSQANVANDPASVANTAMMNASAYSAPSQFAPIGNLFGDFANMYLTRQNANMYGQAGQQARNNFNLGYGQSSPNMFITP